MSRPRMLEKKAQAKRGDLRTHLEELLSPEELTTWEEYEKFKDQTYTKACWKGSLPCSRPISARPTASLPNRSLPRNSIKASRQFESSEGRDIQWITNQAQSRALQKRPTAWLNPLRDGIPGAGTVHEDRRGGLQGRIATLIPSCHPFSPMIEAITIRWQYPLSHPIRRALAEDAVAFSTGYPSGWGSCSALCASLLPIPIPTPIQTMV